MSSTAGADTSPQNWDDNPSTFCQTLSGRQQWLRVTYPCAAGLSRVEVTNRVDGFRDRIREYQMKVTAGSSDDMVSAFLQFDKLLMVPTQEPYTLFVGELNRA